MIAGAASEDRIRIPGDFHRDLVVGRSVRAIVAGRWARSVCALRGVNTCRRRHARTFLQAAEQYSTVRTRATRILDEAGIRHELLEFEAETHTAAEAAERLGLQPAQLFKTLVLRSDNVKILLVLVPGDQTLNLRSLARHAGAKRVEMVDQSELMRLVGYVKGGVSPIGTKRPCPIFVDKSALTHTHISVSAGIRGLQIWIDPRDLVRVTNARAEDLTGAA